MNDAPPDTLDTFARHLMCFWTPDNSGGWNDYPVYVECDDGVTRKVRIIGSSIVPHSRGRKEIQHQFVYDGGIYLKADL